MVRVMAYCLRWKMGLNMKLSVQFGIFCGGMA